MGKFKYMAVIPLSTIIAETMNKALKTNSLLNKMGLIVSLHSLIFFLAPASTVSYTSDWENHVKGFNIRRLKILSAYVTFPGNRSK